eukprot:CAMPEP_0168718652 /NCGR_PEP_ID=MMETSP0724-20121128/631_1 /TAXON_ID=265536 /ORGANISM="Amphiprora sp., Strain CCMP467" /LENGTH=461 /DNA_ID=CAMNT_0008765177 /DNA_START=126 /DNA_END=1511 /DNA_ORIENTATION=-
MPSQAAITPLALPELRQRIVSFLGETQDLMAWDLIARDFANESDCQWGLLANDKYGISMDKGKAGWKLGVSFMKRPILAKMDEVGGAEAGEVLHGSPRLGTNQSLLALTCDDIMPSEEFGISDTTVFIWNATTLHKTSQSMSTPIRNFSAVVCGQQGCETVVTCNADQFCASRASQQQTLTYASILRQADIQNWNVRLNGNGAALLGFEKHLIVVTCGRIFLFDLNEKDTDGTHLVKLKLSRPVSGEEPMQNQGGRALVSSENISWDEDHNQFCFWDPNSNMICVWSYNGEDGSIHFVRSLSTARFTSGGATHNITVTLSENYIIASWPDNTMTVWNRNTGSLCHQSLCDVDEEEDRVDPDELIHPLVIIPVSGDLVVTTSHEGHALCFWNMAKGKMLKKHTDAFESFMSDELPNGCAPTSMVYLREELNTFVCTTCGGLVATWGFPASTEMKRKIKRRGQ